MQLYEEEQSKILKTVHQVQERYRDRQFTMDNLNQLHDEIITRLQDLGFEAVVDVTPLFEHDPVAISITGRTEDFEFDHERMRKEILKAKKEGNG